MTDLTFRPVPDGPDDTPEGYESNGCTCLPGDTRYTLEIEEGVPILKHVACGNPPPDNWGDCWQDDLYMNQIPVIAEWAPDCDGSMWHGMERCEDGASVQVTPLLPEPYRLALSQALGLGTGAPWEALLDRARELGEADAPVAPEIPAVVEVYCGEEPPEILSNAEGKEWHAGDCFCTLPPHGPEVDHTCKPCAERIGMPSWRDPVGE